MFNLIPWLGAWAAVPAFAQIPAGTITVTIGNFISKRGTVSIVLFDSTVKRLESEWVQRAIRRKTLPVTGDQLTTTLDRIPKGRYALLVMHDENGNGRYEYVKEDFGVSNNVNASYGLPAFSKASFVFDGTHLSLPIRLVNENNGRLGSSYVNSLAIAPVLTYAPETNLVLGATLVKLFKFKDEDTLTRTSFLNALGAVTLNRQVVLGQTYAVFSNREQFMFSGFTGFRQFPQYYFGLGNQAPSDHQELIRSNQFRTEHLLLKQIRKGLFAGVGYRYANVFNLSSDTTLGFHQSRIDGYNGSVVSGVQAVLASDNRDNLVNSSNGHLLRFTWTINDHRLGSQFTFQSYEMDLRHYITLSAGRRRVLAMQAYGYVTSGNVPWSELGALGGDRIMRGYYTGRYRDRNYLAVQAEYRLSFNKLLGMVLFAGLGEVADSLPHFTWQQVKPTGGLGLRLTIDRRERLNMRLDYGFGQQTSNFYFTVGEAF